MTPARDLILPVETINRELDAKLFLALVAADAGIPTHIGIDRCIRAHHFQPSVIIYKSVRFAKDLNLMRRMGHSIVAWDEEGLARFSDAIHNSRMEPDALTVPKILFSWGRSNSDLWRRHPFYKGAPILDVGNPRIDLLRPELRGLYAEKVAEYRKAHSSFCLLNSNFGYVNNFKATGKKLAVSASALDSDGYETYRSGLKAHKQKLFDAFLEALPQLAAGIAPHTLIIRPHPSEDHKAWLEASRKLSNVKVIYEGPVVPWILAASCIVHNGCTTAIEATVVGKPALAFRPVKDEFYDIALPNLLSEPFTDAAALAARARQYLDDPETDREAAQIQEVLAENVSSLQGSFASEKITEAISRLVAEAPANSLWTKLTAKVFIYARRIRRKLTDLFRRDIHRYRSHKSDETIFTAEMIAGRAAQFSRVLGRFRDLHFEDEAQGIVMITKRPRS